MPNQTQIKLARTRHRERELANIRALAGAGVREDTVLAAMNRWHLAVLEQQLGGGHVDLHLGLARHGRGVPFCTAGSRPFVWARESLGAFRSPYFSMDLPEQQRWWCGIVWLEQNRGCPSCIARAYQWADEEGWRQPRRLGDLLGGLEGLGPERGNEPTGPRIGRSGFVRGTAG